MKKLILALALISTTTLVNASKYEKIEKSLRLGLISGRCSIMDKQIKFQTENNLKGGDNFFKSFWTVEAAKFDVSLQELYEVCGELMTKYNDTINKLNKK